MSHFLPLRSFFNHLRRQGFNLGVEEYDLFLTALKNDIWIGTEEDRIKEKLFFLCLTLWFKPDKNLKLFTELFEKYFKEELLRRRGLAKKYHEVTNVKTRQDTTIESKVVSNEEAVEGETGEKKGIEASAGTKSEGNDETIADDIDYTEETIEKHIWLNFKSTKSRQGIRDDSALIEQEKLEQQNFLFRGAYRPLSVRDMQLSWLYLRSENVKKTTDYLDVEGTIQYFTKTGQFLPVYHEEISYKARLMILIDYAASMDAFREFAQLLTHLAPVSKFGQIPSVLYFNQIPENTLYKSPQHIIGYDVKDLHNYFSKKKVDIIILSDVGAAQRLYNQMVIDRIRNSLRDLQPIANKMVWLNPMPKHRWRGTNAAYFPLEKVRMFEATKIGLTKAINVLRGKQKI